MPGMKGFGFSSLQVNLMPLQVCIKMPYFQSIYITMFVWIIRFGLWWTNFISAFTPARCCHYEINVGRDRVGLWNTAQCEHFSPWLFLFEFVGRQRRAFEDDWLRLVRTFCWHNWGLAMDGKRFSYYFHRYY